MKSTKSIASQVITLGVVAPKFWEDLTFPSSWLRSKRAERGAHYGTTRSACARLCAGLALPSRANGLARAKLCLDL